MMEQISLVSICVGVGAVIWAINKEKLATGHHIQHLEEIAKLQKELLQCRKEVSDRLRTLKLREEEQDRIDRAAINNEKIKEEYIRILDKEYQTSSRKWLESYKKEKEDT